MNTTSHHRFFHNWLSFWGFLACDATVRSCVCSATRALEYFQMMLSIAAGPGGGGKLSLESEDVVCVRKTYVFCICVLKGLSKDTGRPSQPFSSGPQSSTSPLFDIVRKIHSFNWGLLLAKNGLTWKKLQHTKVIQFLFQTLIVRK